MMVEASVETGNAAVTAPIIINLGKQRKKRIKKLKKGRGKLWAEVTEVLMEVRDNLGDDVEGNVLVPVILVYRQKKRKSKNRISFPLLPLR